MGSKGLRSGENARLPPGACLNPGVDAICGLSLLLVLSLASRGFSPGTPVFPSSQKPTLPNSNSTRNRVDEEPLCGRATSKSLFIYFIIYVFICRCFCFFAKTLRAFSKTPLCNRPSEIYIFTGFSEKTSLGWFIFYWVFLLSCVLPIKAQRGGRPYIFTGMKILNTFYVLL